MSKVKKPDLYDLAIIVALASALFTIGFLVGAFH